MRKLLFLVGILISIGTVQLKAQAPSVAFAAGEIQVRYLDSPVPDNCNAPKRYHFWLKYYRDCSQNPVFPDLDIAIVVDQAKPVNQPAPPTIPVTVGMTLMQQQGQMNNKCIQGQPVCVEGAWYRTTIPISLPKIPLPANLDPASQGPRVRAAFTDVNNLVFPPIQVGKFARSPINNNIEQGERAYIWTDITGMVQSCDVITGTHPVTGEMNQREVNGYVNNSPEWIIEDPYETFCNGVFYEYQLRAVDHDTTYIDLNLMNNNDPVPPSDTIMVTDSLAFRLRSPLALFGTANTFFPGFNSSVPFPSSTPVTFDEKEGILRFTPDLLPSEQTFIAVVSFEVLEFRKLPVIAGNGDILIEPRVISKVTREFRFVIDQNCNNALPNFSALTNPFNVVEQAWEFDCSDTAMDWSMSEPMLVEDLDNGTFRLLRGTAQFPTEPSEPFDFDTIIPLNVMPTGEFTDFRLILSRPIGPGHYSLFAKKSVKGTTLKNLCGFALPENENIPIYVNNRSNYTFFQDQNIPLLMCHTSDFIAPDFTETNPAKLDVFKKQGDAKKSKYKFSTWKPVGVADTLKDTSFAPQTGYSIALETDINGDLIFPGGLGQGQLWEVEYAEDFSWYNYEGIKQEEECIGSDLAFIQFLQSDTVNIPNFDLCPEESFPLIDLDSMVTLYQAIDFQWKYYDNTAGQFSDKISVGTTPISTWVPAGGASDTLDTTKNLATKNSQLEIGSIAHGVGNTFWIESVVVFPNGCREIDTFFVRNLRVEVDIQPTNDTIICPGRQFMLENAKVNTYLTPEIMTSEWFLNDELIVGADSNTLMITDSGMYKLRVTKITQTGEICFGEDSILVDIADSLGPPEPVCANVTWNTDLNQVEQRFFTPALEGAEDFQVRETDINNVTGDWQKTSDALEHLTIGPQVRVQVRGVNFEVPEDSECRFGPPSILAEPCNVAVRPLNIFTPNGDGINDLMRFDLLEVFPGSSLQIFNRWGKLIYESDNYLNDWDGEDYKDGTYFYILDVNDESQGILKGTVTIVR